MKITDVRVFETKGKKSSLLAFASITVDDALVVGGFRIIDGSRGTFVAMPSQLGADDDYHDQVYPITADARKDITGKILDAYEKIADGDGEEAQKPAKKKYRR